VPPILVVVSRGVRPKTLRTRKGPSIAPIAILNAAFAMGQKRTWPGDLARFAELKSAPEPESSRQGRGLAVCGRLSVAKWFLGAATVCWLVRPCAIGSFPIVA
jgi:hypothetical protein